MFKSKRKKYLDKVYKEVMKSTEEFIERSKTQPMDISFAATEAKHFEDMFSAYDNNKIRTIRDIKFRGKSIGNGEWMFGDLISRRDRHLYIAGYDTNDMWCEEHVIEETIGQYTGLKDHKGYEIYEGDIVKSTEYKDSNYVVEFRDGMFYANIGPCNFGVYGGYPLWLLCKGGLGCKIIGNVYDNKDLLKGN